MLNIYKLHYVSGSTNDCMYIFLYVIYLPLLLINIKKSTLGTKVLQGQESYYDGIFWHFGF